MLVNWHSFSFIPLETQNVNILSMNLVFWRKKQQKSDLKRPVLVPVVAQLVHQKLRECKDKIAA
jgi:hypothetical protein